MLTTDELNRWLRDQWARRGYTLAEGERHGVELRELVEQRTDRRRMRSAQQFILVDVDLRAHPFAELFRSERHRLSASPCPRLAAPD